MRSKVFLGVAGALLGLVVAEFGSRIVVGDRVGSFSQNPVIRKQVESVDLFEPDEELGHQLRGGKFIGVYQRGQVTAKEIASDPARQGKLLVLNLGDSSTSGWDSNVVVENGRRHRQGLSLKSPFQTYSTYSSILAEAKWLYVVNAGVPGYSTIQGANYLRRRFKELCALGVRVDVATIYFGNNDSAWNGNIQDCYVLPYSSFHLRLLRILSKAMSSFRVIPRVTPRDYARNLSEIIATCHKNETSVVLIEPVVPLQWPPGLRAEGLQNEELEQQASLAGTEVLKLLLRARKDFGDGRTSFKLGEYGKARIRLEMAREGDYVVPRIKESYRQALRRLAEEEGVPLVSVGERIPLDDSRYFMDYCHPVEPANRLIADDLLTVLRKQSWPHR